MGGDIDFTTLNLPMSSKDLNEFRQHFVHSGAPLPPHLAVNRIDLSVLYRQKWNTAWENFVRIKKFAEINKVTFIERIDDFFYPGIMAAKSDFGMRTLYNCIRIEEAPRIEWGNFDWFGEHNNPKSHIHFGYIAIELTQYMPHMILDSRRNNVRSFGVEESQIKSQFSSDQRIELEGDFAKYFTLYAPLQYRQDAYYIFTPDFMAELVDEAGDFDVEIIDNYMFLYRTAPFTQYTPELIDRILRIVSIVGAKAQLRSGRYRDGRVISSSNRQAIPSVALEGRRLIPDTTLYKVIAIVLWLFALYILAMAVKNIVDALH